MGLVGLILFGLALEAFGSDCNFSFTKLPTTLSKTCLYEDLESKILRPELQPFAPQFPLWTDGAEKHRWVYLPPGSRIDTSQRDHWNFPVGTIFWKEFSLDGKRLETRVIKKIKDTREPHGEQAPINWIFGAYVWNETETEAHLAEWEVLGARGTNHTVPSPEKCYSCHGLDGAKQVSSNEFVAYRDFRPLGFAAFQLAQDLPEIYEPCRGFLHPSYLTQATPPSLTLKTLIEADRMSHLHDWPSNSAKVPGSSLERATFGYLAANCAHCHSSSIPDSHSELASGFFGAASFVMMDLNIVTSETAPQKQPAFRSLVNQKTTYYARGSGGVYRVKAGDYKSSAIWRRFISSSYDHMPQAGSRVVDPYGRCLMEHWISSL